MGHRVVLTNRLKQLHKLRGIRVSCSKFKLCCFHTFLKAISSSVHNQKCFMKTHKLSQFSHFQPSPPPASPTGCGGSAKSFKAPRDQVRPSLSEWEQLTYTRVNGVNWLTSSKSIMIPWLYKKRGREKINGVNDPCGFCLSHEKTRTRTQGTWCLCQVSCRFVWVFFPSCLFNTE